VQLFIEADGRHYLTEQHGRRDTWVRVALFDVITNNADRKSGHCLFDSDDMVWVVDHGLTFHVDHKLRTVIWGFAGDPLEDDLCRDVERALVQVEKGELGKKLDDLIRPEKGARSTLALSIANLRMVSALASRLTRPLGVC
jgi:uncharacterized repeat protein (TIGR03843 family)